MRIRVLIGLAIRVSVCTVGRAVFMCVCWVVCVCVLVCVRTQLLVRVRVCPCVSFACVSVLINVCMRGLPGWSVGCVCRYVVVVCMCRCVCVLVWLLVCVWVVVCVCVLLFV